MHTAERAAPEAAPAIWRRSASPLAAGTALVAGAAYVALVTPGDGRTIPCPFHAATGLWCPGCGLTRAVHHLLRCDIPGALSFNVLAPIVVIATMIGWWSWFSGAAWGRPVRWPSRVDVRWWYGLFGAFAVFGVLRNLPPFHVLAP